MKKWWLKCALQLLFSHIPGGGDRINHLLRRKKLYAQFDELTLRQAARHIEILNQAHININNELVMEIGTGWKPIYGYVFRITGCRRVLLCDIYPHLDRRLLVMTINQLRENAQMLSELLRIDDSCIDRVLPHVLGQSFVTLLEGSGFEYISPLDLRRTRLPGASVGIIASRATLEHIPSKDLRQIFREMRRIIKPSGAMVHTIDHSDHWQHFDDSISRINFLKIPDWWWTIIGENSITYQNRLRSNEYIDMIREAGFRISYIDAKPNQQALDDAQRMKIIKRYRDLNPTKVAVLTTHLLAEPF